jgi:hypothetical protein
VRPSWNSSGAVRPDGRFNRANIRDELIAAAADCRNVAVAQCTAERDDGLAQVVFFYDRVGPQRIEQGRALEHDTRMLEEIDERVECPRRQVHRSAFGAGQHSAAAIQAELPELERLRCR